MHNWIRTFAGLGLSSLLSILSTQANAQTPHADWSGVWQASGSPFMLKVHSQNDLLHVEAIESMGLVWQNSPGTIHGDSATFEVQYQGVTATVLVQKTDAETAIARPLSCQPDYHIVCALVQNQQALFVKQHTSP